MEVVFTDYEEKPQQTKGDIMKKYTLKVAVKSGCEKYFENYCSRHDIFYKVYPVTVLKTIYRAECKDWQLYAAKEFIKSIEDMPTISLS